MPNASDPLTFIAHGSCANQNKAGAFWSQLSRLRPQLFVFNGDIVYGDCDCRACDPTDCTELSGAWSRLFSLTNFGAVRSNLPMLGMLDDHDYGQNDCSIDNPYKHFAKAQFLRRWSAPPTDARWDRPGVYMSSVHGPVGRRTQILLTDTRWSKSAYVRTDCPYWRDDCDSTGKERYVPYNASNGGGARAQEGGPRMLSEEQWAWLEGELRRPAEVRLLFSTVQVLADGHGWERWGLVPHERRRLLELIGSTGARGVVLLSGDRHVGGHYMVGAGEYGAPYAMHEITSSSLTHSYRGLADDGTVRDEPGPNRIGPLVHENHLGTVRVDWAARTVSLKLVASDDCGVSHQAWGRQCDAPGSGVAGAVLLDVTLPLDQLAPGSG